MSTATGIEWTERVWNPVVGCTPVSPGCLNCYAATMARRLEGMGKPEYQPREVPLTAKELREAHAAVGGGKLHDHERVKEIRIAEVCGGRAVFTGDVRTVPDRLDVPLKRRTPTVWFVNSMSDLFHGAVPFEFIDRVFAVMALCPQHTFQVLTKRPVRMAEYMTRRRVIYDGFSRKFGASKMEKSPCDDVYTIVRKHPGHERDALIWPLPNVWLGTSVEDQQRADERIPHLLRCPAAVRFLSCEPLLGAVDLSQWLWTMDGDRRHGRLNHLHWVITGGESGPKSRPCNVEWIRSIVTQCKAAGVPCFTKQLGAMPVVTDAEAVAIGNQWKAEGLTGRHYCGRGDGTFVLTLKDKKGGDPAEWPQDLRVREMPTIADAAGTPSAALENAA
ncbi:MAG: DUF5131 family protein [Phycisphaerales bacterium]